ncbi:MAG: PKD domain-containing protein [Flavobacteriales bacterium]
MRYRIATVIGTLGSGLLGHATHILGGEMFYAYLGNDDYAVTLKMYRDCGPGNTNGTGFDATAEMAVYDANGNWLFSEFPSFTIATNVPVQLNNPCLQVLPVMCVEAAEYVAIINLPPITGGYNISYQRCCRTPTIINIITPDQYGITCSVSVPDANTTGVNSSAVFNLLPPIALCSADPMLFDHSAVDPDGDQLVYSLVTPWTGGSQVDPMPSPPPPPPYSDIPWAAGFSTANVMGTNPPLAIDASSGLMTVLPSALGQYVVCVRVQEFRNGQMISETRRDFRFEVVPCQLAVVSAIQQQQNLCNGYTVNFNSQSINGTFYHWDFGDPNILNDTSNIASPSWTYADTGSYTVTLIAQPGWPCADTATATFQVFAPINPSFAAPPPMCMQALPVQLDALGFFGSNAVVDWDLGPNGSQPSMQGDPIMADFISPGNYAVELTITANGCTESYTDSVRLYPSPVPAFTPDTSGCVPLPVQFANGSSAWTPMLYEWDFGDGSTSNAATPLHSYQSAGVFDVGLKVMTNSGCIDTVDLVHPLAVRTWPQPVAGFSVQPPTVNIMDPVVLVTDQSQQAVQWTYWVDGEQVTDPSFLWTFSDAGEFGITQIVSTSNTCADTARMVVAVRDHLFYAPNAFTPDGDGVNEIFLPHVIGAVDYELLVFDRWGMVQFRTTETGQGWDGSAAPPEVYSYKATVVDHGGHAQDYFGSVTLVR